MSSVALIFMTFSTAVWCNPLSVTPDLVEGDIIKNALFKGAGLTDQHRLNRRSVTHTLQRQWTNGVVPYVISVDTSDASRAAIKDGMDEIERFSCVTFTPFMHKKHPDFIDFIPGQSCYSHVGCQGGRQVISIGDGCSFKHTVIHEILHALGMLHEQTRLDRDLYLNIFWWNIQTGAEENFETYKHDPIDSMKFPYDFHSATHYFNKDFSKNGMDTLQSKDRPTEALGNQNGLSKIDILKLNTYYKCENRSFKKSPCADQLEWCYKYKHHCSTKWFAEEYCQKTCRTCFT